MFIGKIKSFIKDNFLEKIQYIKYKYLFKMNVSKTAKISRKALLDTTNPNGINIGEYTIITTNVSILTHDFINQEHKSTFIGNNCFIGMNSVILAGVTIGNNVIIAAGSIVNKDVPSNCLAGGNPVKIIKENIKTTKYGINPEKYNG
jgi:acetyltransferase-like isoleucine patch superfamily enzyme